jgi:hypothetical protein
MDSSAPAALGLISTLAKWLADRQGAISAATMTMGKSRQPAHATLHRVVNLPS